MSLAQVYIMEDRGAFKVGHSKNPNDRRRQLGAHLKVVHTSQPMANARRVEWLAQRLLALAGKRVAGELFSATLDEAKIAIARAVRIEAGLEPDVTAPRAVKQSQELRQNCPGLMLMLNMRVNAKFKEALRRIRHLDPNVPSISDVVRAAVFEKLERAEHGDRRR